MQTKGSKIGLNPSNKTTLLNWAIVEWNHTSHAKTKESNQEMNTHVNKFTQVPLQLFAPLVVATFVATKGYVSCSGLRNTGPFFSLLKFVNVRCFTSVRSGGGQYL